MTLHTITGRARKCGPNALSAITGRPSHECAAVLRDVTGRRAIHGVAPRHMLAALRRHYGRAARLYRPKTFRPPTLAAWLRDRAERVASGRRAYILIAGNHYVCVCGGMISDNGYRFAKRPRPLAQAPAFRRARVTGWIVVDPQEA